MTKKRNSPNDLTFSNPGIEPMKVLEDFDVYYKNNNSICWWKIDEETLIDPPVELVKYVKDYFRFSTNRLEKSRRFIIMSFILSALGKVNEEEECGLIIDEEKALSVNVKGKKYSGKIDFVIGHSKVIDEIPDDSCIIVLEAKIPKSFDKSIGQLMAQASTTMRIRSQRASGSNKSPIFMIRTDGNKWQFGKLRLKTEDDVNNSKSPVTEEFIIQLSEELNLGPESKYNVQIKEIFTWVYMTLKNMHVSTPRLNKNFKSLSILSIQPKVESLEIKTAVNEYEDSKSSTGS